MLNLHNSFFNPPPALESGYTAGTTAAKGGDEPYMNKLCTYCVYRYLISFCHKGLCGKTCDPGGGRQALPYRKWRSGLALLTPASFDMRGVR